MLRSFAGTIYRASPGFLGHLTGRVIILMYHRVVTPAEARETFIQPGTYVTTTTFARHVKLLRERFHVISFGELLERWDTGEWDPHRRYAVITFDDGWLDTYRHAYPLLRGCGATAAVFLPTALIGTDEWLWFDRLGHLLSSARSGTTDDWDAQIERAKALTIDERERMIETLASAGGASTTSERRFMNWDEVREMAADGFEFGSHSHTHANLARANGEALEAELRKPLEVFAEQGVVPLPILAYPNGDYAAATPVAARAAGYRGAVTTHAGAESRVPADCFALKRVGVHDDVSRSVAQLALHMARQTWH